MLSLDVWRPSALYYTFENSVGQVSCCKREEKLSIEVWLRLSAVIILVKMKKTDRSVLVTAKATVVEHLQHYKKTKIVKKIVQSCLGPIETLRDPKLQLLALAIFLRNAQYSLGILMGPLILWITQGWSPRHLGLQAALTPKIGGMTAICLIIRTSEGCINGTFANQGILLYFLIWERR